jgi:hypothetical protein
MAQPPVQRRQINALQGRCGYVCTVNLVETIGTDWDGANGGTTLVLDLAGIAFK